MVTISAIRQMYVIIFFTFFSVPNMFSQQSISQSPKLIKSVLAQVGSSTVSYKYTDSSAAIVTTIVQQSIGQSGAVGLASTSNHSVQQGYLNNFRTFNIDNTTVEFVETMDMIIYPNPFKDFVKLKFSKPTTYPVQIEVFDVRGRLVLNQNFPASDRITVSMDRLEDASYMIRVSSGSQKFLKKLIKGN